MMGLTVVSRYVFLTATAQAAKGEGVACVSSVSLHDGPKNVRFFDFFLFVESTRRTCMYYVLTLHFLNNTTSYGWYYNTHLMLILASKRARVILVYIGGGVPMTMRRS